MNNLATVMSSRGKCERAEEMHREALKLRETVLRKEHPSTLTSMDNLALVLRHQGNLAHPFCSQNRFEQASTRYQRALSGYRQTLGSTHPTTLAVPGITHLCY